MSKNKSNPSKKAGILACKNVVTRSSIERKGIRLKRGTPGIIKHQRETPAGYGRSTVDFDGKEVEVENSKLRCI